MTTVVALIGFLGLTGLALDYAFRESALSAQAERIESQFFTLLALVEIDEAGTIRVPREVPAPVFDQLGSGHYASIVGESISWRSHSMVGTDIQFPAGIASGESQLRMLNTPQGKLRVYSMAVSWELQRGPVPLTIHVAEEMGAVTVQINEFRGALWLWLAAAAGLLLLVQTLSLWWSVKPVRRMRNELASIEKGHRERLSGDFPKEIQRVAYDLNTLLSSQRERLERYRKSLADLAHSLKTPLAIMRSRSQTMADEELSAEFSAQISRMDDIVAYQLQRAATSGFQALSKPLPIVEVLEPLVGGLEKLHADRRINCEFDVDDQALFYGSRGDLTELLGNLLENAFKWCESRVEVAVQSQLSATGEQSLKIAVSDDGPGIPIEQRERVLQRGMRADERVPGHGIGLAIVVDIVSAYEGELCIDRSDWGGACLTVRFPHHGMPRPA